MCVCACVCGCLSRARRGAVRCGAVRFGGVVAQLFDRIVDKEKYSELEATHAFAQMTEAIGHCHEHGIVHRDLKVWNRSSSWLRLVLARRWHGGVAWRWRRGGVRGAAARSLERGGLGACERDVGSARRSSRLLLVATRPLCCSRRKGREQQCATSAGGRTEERRGQERRGEGTSAADRAAADRAAADRAAADRAAAVLSEALWRGRRIA